MNNKNYLLRSKIAQRLLWHSLLSVLLPLCIVFAIAYYYLNQYLEQTSQVWQQQAKNNYQILIKQRFEHLKQELWHLGQHGRTGDPLWVADLNKPPYSLSKRLTKLALVDTRGETRNLLGDGSQLPQLNALQLTRLQTQNQLVLLASKGSEINADLLIFQKLSNTNYLAAAINTQYLFALPTNFYRSHYACIFDSRLLPLFCNNMPPKHLLTALRGRAQIQTHGRFDWTMSGTEYQQEFWPLLENANTGLPKLTALISTSQQNPFTLFTQSIFTVQLTVALALCLVMLMAIRQIRRLITPIKQLEEGTKSITQKQFQTRIHVDSKDEIATLANSFNEMSTVLGRQFSALEAMARIDQLILNAVGIDNIVETLLLRLAPLLPCETMSIVILNDVGDFKGRLYFREAVLSSKINVSEIQLSEDESKLLRENNTVTYYRAGQYIPQYLQPLQKDYIEFSAFPIFFENKLSAIVILNFAKHRELSKAELKQASDVTYRVAVALSNAAWEDKLYHQAHFDPLTNLPNRLLFQDRLQQAMERADRDQNVVALMFLDLDGFKYINDTMGHDAGDDLLIEVANRIKRCVRAIDTVSRLGGDEFTIIFPDLHNSDQTQHDISRIAEKLLEATAAPVELRKQKLSLTVSIGIAMYPSNASNNVDFIKHADMAMYHAKENGKSNYKFYDIELNNINHLRLTIEHQLQEAVKSRQFVLCYQPIIDLASGHIIGCEALIRWLHPERGFILPGEFIPLAEKKELIHELGHWIISQALGDLKSWHTLGFDKLSVSINIASKQFGSERLAHVLRETLDDYKIQPSQLIIEITESTLMDDIDQTQQMLAKLNDLGVKLAIDDFGTGYSSLSYLKAFPIHYVKIEQGFISDLHTDQESMAIVSAIISLAQKLDLTVIAEGVERIEDVEFLKSEGCHGVQGFYYSRPLPANEFGQLLQKARKAA